MRERFPAFAPAGPLPSAPGGFTWPELMQEALLEAENSRGLGEVPVGALVLSPQGRIMGRAGNRVIWGKDPTAHAEILAIRQAARALGNERLCGCILVATLEPCLMCAAAIIQARIAGVVFGCADAREGAIISRADYIQLTGQRDMWHLGGVSSAPCAAILKEFFTARR